MARKPWEMAQTQIRFQENLRKRLVQAARRNHRSMNSEMVDRLERSFVPREDLAAAIDYVLERRLASAANNARECSREEESDQSHDPNN